MNLTNTVDLDISNCNCYLPFSLSDVKHKPVRHPIPDLDQDEQRQRGVWVGGGGGVSGDLAIQQPGAQHGGGQARQYATQHP